MRARSRTRPFPGPLLLALAVTLAPATARAAGGAFVVDDSEIGKPGECKAEAWASFAANRDMIANLAPACVADLGVPVELGGQIQRSHEDDVWATNIGPKAKVALAPAGTGRIGVALTGSAFWNADSGGYVGHVLTVPVTLQLRDDFRLNLNAGWLYEGAARTSYAVWGAGFEWQFAQPLTLIGEIYGYAGPPGDTSAVTDPRAQLGLRLTPVKNADVDLIYGHNIAGENSHWLTVGVNLRF